MQDFSKEEKRARAAESRKAPPKYGTEAKQQIINSLHARMLAADKVLTCKCKVAWSHLLHSLQSRHWSTVCYRCPSPRTWPAIA